MADDDEVAGAGVADVQVVGVQAAGARMARQGAKGRVRAKGQGGVAPSCQSDSYDDWAYVKVPFANVIH